MGETINDPTAVQEVYNGIVSRPGWSGVNAVRDGKVLILYSRIGTSPLGLAMAPLYIAKTAYPEQFQDCLLYTSLFCRTGRRRRCRHRRNLRQQMSRNKSRISPPTRRITDRIVDKVSRKTRYLQTVSYTHLHQSLCCSSAPSVAMRGRGRPR